MISTKSFPTNWVFSLLVNNFSLVPPLGFMINFQSQITSGVPPSLHDKPKVFLATSQSQSSSQAMLFTPNQPQIHRSPQSGSTLQRPRQNPQPNVPKPVSLSSTSGNTFLASVSKSSIPKTGQSVTSQPTKQPPIMQVKVLNQPTTT